MTTAAADKETGHMADPTMTAQVAQTAQIAPATTPIEELRLHVGELLVRASQAEAECTAAQQACSETQAAYRRSCADGDAAEMVRLRRAYEEAGEQVAAARVRLARAQHAHADAQEAYQRAAIDDLRRHVREAHERHTTLQRERWARTERAVAAGQPVQAAEDNVPEQDAARALAALQANLAGNEHALPAIAAAREANRRALDEAIAAAQRRL